MACVSFFVIFPESNLHPLPGKTALNLTTKQGARPFLQEAFIASEVNLNSLGLPGDIQRPGMSLSDATLQSKSWLIKLPLKTDLL